MAQAEEKVQEKKPEKKVKKGDDAKGSNQIMEDLRQEITKMRDDYQLKYDKPRRVIVMAVDSSETSKQAVSWAAKNTLQQDDIIMLFAVWEDAINFTPPAMGMVPSVVPVMIDMEEIRKQNRQHLQQARQLLREMYHQHFDDKQHHVLSLLVASHASDKQTIGKLILQAGDKFEADLIVIGSRGLGAVKQFFMGSVSNYVVHHAHRPVLVIKH
jgi:nucleotide-binding universal stress UspA family protein